MAKLARAAMGVEELTAIADRGYFKGNEILACNEAGITAIVPKTMTSGAKADGRFDRQISFTTPRRMNTVALPGKR